MPAIVLRIRFKDIWGNVLEKDKVVDILSEKFTAVDTAAFENRLKKIFIWEEDRGKKALEVMKMFLATYALGDLGGATTLGIFDSTVPDYIEFWICSPEPEQCIKGREIVLKNIPSLWNGIRRKIESDRLLLEGGALIDREGYLSRYVRGDLNIGFIVSFIIALLDSVKNYLSTSNGEFDYALPLYILAFWLIVLFGEVLYYKGRGVYIVKKRT